MGLKKSEPYGGCLLVAFAIEHNKDVDSFTQCYALM